MDKKQGRLIVIDGIDGSGKSTQIELLKRALASQGLALQVISFPRYEDNIYGKLIKRYLEGEFGSITEVNPYLMALAFAGDRVLAKAQIEKWLGEGKLVIANRYVSASKAHLGANLPSEKRDEFIKWVDKLEYGENKIPKEDLTIILSVDPKTGQHNVQGIHGQDIHEDSLEHLDRANKIYLELAPKEDWQMIDCMDGNQMKNAGDIHNKLISLLQCAKLT